MHLTHMIVFILGINDLVEKALGYGKLESSVPKAKFLYHANLQIKSIDASAELERLFCQLPSD